MNRRERPGQACSHCFAARLTFVDSVDWLIGQKNPSQSRTQTVLPLGVAGLSRGIGRSNGGAERSPPPPLTWGRGPRQFEIFLEPTCPYSVRAFAKLDETLTAAGSDNVTIKIRLHSQPWHMYSGVIVRCVLAASTLPTGKEAAKAVLTAVAAHREEFEFTKHCSGPNMGASPKHIIARLETYSELKLADAFAILNLDREVKLHIKYARQNGIHVSPTFMIDGLVQPDMSSGDKVSDWVSRLLAS